MLFPSQAFILLFLPLVLWAYYRTAHASSSRTWLLCVASAIFYAWWDPRFLPLLLILIAFNWLLAYAYARIEQRWILFVGIAANLAVLGFFKYANFVAENLLQLAGVPFEPWNIILPLGISFFTFQQISYLVDLGRGEAPRYCLRDYAAYVSFFPQLIAGPIVRHNEIIPQFTQTLHTDELHERIGRGLVLFILGLVKKVFFADELAPLADSGFELAANGQGLDSAAAWLSALAYTLQLYFDFSAYSDMAMGLAAMFGFVIPLNFDCPYRALSVREFWRRWHMTLSRFLRDYVYIPLGGNRVGGWTYAIVLVTMLLCGLWHGAGWAFVLWGGMHGVAVCINRWWAGLQRPLPTSLAWSLTFLFVVLGWVLFRAEDAALAWLMYEAMFSTVPLAFDSDDWIPVIIGLGFALIGPSNVMLAQQRLTAQRLTGFGLALALLAVCLQVGAGSAVEFLYFQF